MIIGAGWIGLEVAAAARGHGCEVTVTECQQTPLHGIVGAEIGQYFVDLHTAQGVTFRLSEGVERLVGDGAVTGVITTPGKRFPADTVLVGVGISPNTPLAEKAAGIEVDDGILCDQSLHTSAADVFAAGDVANWVNPTLQQHIRVDHWANAHDGGFAAGRSMLGSQVSYDVVPFFFSDQYVSGVEYTGHVPEAPRPDSCCGATRKTTPHGVLARRGQDARRDARQRLGHPRRPHRPRSVRRARSERRST